MPELSIFLVTEESSIYIHTSRRRVSEVLGKTDFLQDI